ncbi:MAG: DUF1311 domain-containing protein, partial [Planctomycetales bacterium]|nr:DUF1311 domain-containing protein [Planctomycetales bacterium]
MKTPTPTSPLFCIFAALLGFTSATSGGKVHAASFECGKASTSIEKSICRDTRLNAADEQLGAIYSMVRRNLPDAASIALKAEQNRWIKSRNEQCASGSVECLTSWIEARISALEIQYFLPHELTSRNAPSDETGNHEQLTAATAGSTRQLDNEDRIASPPPVLIQPLQRLTNETPAIGFTCHPKDTTARILASPNPNDLKPGWTGESKVGTSWTFQADHAVVGSYGEQFKFMVGQLLSSRGGVVDSNVYALQGEWDCSWPKASEATEARGTDQELTNTARGTGDTGTALIQTTSASGLLDRLVDNEMLVIALLGAMALVLVLAIK